MLPLTPSFLVAAANALAGLRQTGSDSSAPSSLLLRVRSALAQPSGVQLVHDIGYWSHFDHRVGRSSWPLPWTPSCNVLADFAARRDVLLDQPLEGDVFVARSRVFGGFVQTGIVVAVHGMRELADGDVVHSCTTVEAGRAAAGIATPPIVRRLRRFSRENGDRFIHWADLDWRVQAA